MMTKINEIYFSLFTFLFVSCSLGEDPRDQLYEEEAHLTPTTLFLNTVATLYNYIGGHEDGQGLQGTCRGVYDLQTFGSDEVIIPTRGGDWYDGGIWQDMYRHSWGAGHSFPNKAWTYLYKVITLCNRSLEHLDDHRDLLDAETYTVYTSEARALRAVFYWYLLDLFGNVPIITSSRLSMNDVTQSSRAEVFGFVEKELWSAYPHLSTEKSNKEGNYYGRVTQAVALFTLAKLMLNAEVYAGTPRWQDCIDVCDRIEQLGYRLETSYAKNFAVHNEASEENIWVIPMDREVFQNQQQNLYRSYHYRHAAAYGFLGENGTCATPHIMKIFGLGTPEEDARLELNYWTGTVSDTNGRVVTDRVGNPLVYYPWEVKLDLSGSPYVETAGARMKKYEVDLNALKDGTLMENDIVLFRFADVLLMRAEAKLRSGQDGQADYDAVRSRVGMPTRPISLQNLLDERLFELCWEGWRRQDLIRFGQYKSLFEGDYFNEKADESDGHTCLYPIPSDVLLQIPGMKQNPGY